MTADAPFQALTDEQHIYIFRQSIAETNGDMIFKTESGGASGDSERDDYVLDIDGNTVPIVKDTLLVDRFILAGTELKPTMEVRYQRSRHKTHPHSNKDTLGSKDMDGRPFFEPTQELAFVCHLQQGRFSVLLLPTQISEVQRWQVFSHNSRTGLIDSFNIERGADGLFNTKGTQLYTSPDPEYQQSVLERQPGQCPFTDRDLIPLVSKSGYAESALAFDGQDDYIDCGNILPASYTKEAWIKKLGTGNNHIVSGTTNAQHGCWMPDGKLSAGHNGDWKAVAESQPSRDGVWIHVAVTYDCNDRRMVLYKDGIEVDRATDLGPASGDQQVYIGRHNQGSYFNGQIDEVRIWDRARTADEIKADLNHRLIGNELGLVGYWRFDEGSGNTAHDQTENANHGTIHGNATWVNSDAPVGDHPGMRRTSFKFEGRRIESGIASLLQFDGHGYVEVNHHPTLEMPVGQDFTLSAWIKTTEKADYPRILAKRQSGNSQKGYEIYIHESTGCLGVNLDTGNTNSGLQGQTNVADGQWHHIAMVLEGTTASFYLDGVPDGSTTNTNLAQGFSNTVNLRIAGKTGPGVNFQGQIDEVRIWDCARTADEIKADMNHRLIGNELGLVGYWRFDEASGNTVHDQTENANDGTIHGNPTWENYQVPVGDHPGFLLEFDGQGDYIDCGNILPESYTKEAWIKKLSGTQSGYHNIISGNNNAIHAFGMPNGKLSAGHSNTQIVKESQASTDGVWIHVAVTYDRNAQSMVLYKDGIEVDRAASVSPPSGNLVQIGSYNTGNYFEGQIDEVRIWDRARTADEIKADMNHRLIGNELGLVGYWRFD